MFSGKSSESPDGLGQNAFYRKNLINYGVYTYWVVPKHPHPPNPYIIYM